MEMYNETVTAGKALVCGCKGLYNGSKANVLDALQILKTLWDENEKYCKVDTVKNVGSKQAFCQSICTIN